jgi:hypothetical protein
MNHGESMEYPKRTMPDAYCVRCRMPQRNMMTTNARCQRVVGIRKTCGGGIRSANNVGDWAECPSCGATGFQATSTCIQCSGDRWTLARKLL